jgi:hypothetical protein
VDNSVLSGMAQSPIIDPPHAFSGLLGFLLLL